jgi:hypothetical protein
MLKTNWTKRSKYAYHFRLNNQHDLGRGEGAMTQMA